MPDALVLCKGTPSRGQHKELSDQDGHSRSPQHILISPSEEDGRGPSLQDPRDLPEAAERQGPAQVPGLQPPWRKAAPLGEAARLPKAGRRHRGWVRGALSAVLTTRPAILPRGRGRSARLAQERALGSLSSFPEFLFVNAELLKRGLNANLEKSIFMT